METMHPGSGTAKICPRCAEEIKLEARVCRFCAAEFEVLHRGYCQHCHGVVEIDAMNPRCPACGDEVIDVRTESRLVSAVGPSGQPPPPPAAWPPVAAAASTEIPPAFVGRLRTGLVPSTRQWLGVNLAGVAAVFLLAMPWAGLAIEGLRIDEEQGGRLVREAHSLGPVFTVLGIAIALAVPHRVLPRRVGGSWFRAKAGAVPFLRTVRSELGARALYKRDGYVARTVVMLVLWVAALAVFAAVSEPDPGFVARGGTPTTWVILISGLVSTVAMLPIGRSRAVIVDDEGNFAPEEDVRAAS